MGNWGTAAPPAMLPPTWICEACRSMVMTWLAPATVSIFATSLAEIGARLCNGHSSQQWQRGDYVRAIKALRTEPAGLSACEDGAGGASKQAGQRLASKQRKERLASNWVSSLSGSANLVLFVLPGVGVVRKDDRDTGCRRVLARVDQDQALDEVIVDLCTRSSTRRCRCRTGTNVSISTQKTRELGLPSRAIGTGAAGTDLA